MRWGAQLQNFCLSVALMCFSTPLHAMDPFSAAVAVSSVASTVSSLVDGAGEVASLSNAFTELYSEVDSDARVDASARRLINEVNEIKRYADELGYTEQELSSLTSDQYSAENLNQLTKSIQNLTRAVRAGKRAIRLVGSMKSKAETSQVEGARTQAESLSALYLILEHEQKRNLDTVKKELKDRVDRIDLYLSMERDMAANGGKYFSGTRILVAFPRMELVQKAIDFSRMYLVPLATIMLIMFGLRVLISSLSLETGDSFIGAKKDLILCGIFLVSYTLVLKLIFDASAGITQSTSFGEFQNLNGTAPHGPSSVWEALRTDYKVLLAIIFEGMKWLIYTCIQFLVNWVIAFMVGILPLVAVLAIMSGHRGVLTAYLMGLFALSLWVLFWNFGGWIATFLWKNTINPLASIHALKSIVYSAIATLAQFVAPFIAVVALKMGGASPASAVGGLAIKGGAAKVTAATSLALSQGKGFVAGATRSESKDSGTFGQVLGWGMNQGVGRVGNGMRAGVKGAKRGQGFGDTAKGLAMGFARGAVYHDAEGRPTASTDKSRGGRLLDGIRMAKAKPKNNGKKGRRV